MNDTYRYKIEQELMEAFAHEKSDAALGMPDIEGELLRVRSTVDKKKRSSRLVRSAAGVAACLAIVAGIGITHHMHQLKSRNFCVAYVNGVRIADEAAAMDMMQEEMSNFMDEGSISEGQLNEIFNE